MLEHKKESEGEQERFSEKQEIYIVKQNGREQIKDLLNNEKTRKRKRIKYKI